MESTEQVGLTDPPQIRSIPSLKKVGLFKLECLQVMHMQLLAFNTIIYILWVVSIHGLKWRIQDLK